MLNNSNQNIINCIAGDNFSGRSKYLKQIIEQDENILNKETNLFIGEQPTNYISGIFPTVKDEIQLHRTGENIILEKEIIALLSQLGFEKHYYKNPFSLSGGEQAILVILCNLLLNAKKLCIDTTIEQLNENWYKPLFNFLLNSKEIQSSIYISDNRLIEYELPECVSIEPTADNTLHKYKFLKPALVIQDKSEAEVKSITIKNLTFAYDKANIVFKNLDYKFESGSIYHLKGDNGAGKSTLAKILVGILKLRTGNIFVNDIAYSSFNYPGALCGYSFQNPDEQLFSNTIEKEVLPFIKVETNKYRERREHYITMFGLQEIRKCHPAEMPFVIRKRIAIASTLAMDKPWYILDEPTLGQDNEFINFLLTLLQQLKSQGKGIILISHCKTLIQKLNTETLNLSSNN